MTNIFQPGIFIDAKREQSYRIATHYNLFNLVKLCISINKLRNNEAMTSIHYHMAELQTINVNSSFKKKRFEYEWAFVMQQNLHTIN